MTNFEIVQSFCEAWVARELDSCLEYCTHDIVWDNVPIKTFEGKVQVRRFLEKYADGMSNAHHDIRNHLEAGDLLMIEAVEMYDKGGHSVAVPYMALLTFRDAKIAGMRDYFDLAAVERQLGLTD